MKRIGLLVVPVLLAACSSSAGSPKSTSLPSLPFDSITVPYGIYVGGVYTGAACGPFTNSGYFSNLDFDSVFHNVVFAPPSSSGLPGPLGGLLKADSDLQAAMAYKQVTGEGKVARYSLCPMYETETDSYPCKVTEGPTEFPVSISIMAPQGDDGSATLKFETGSPEAGKSIMRWDGKIGSGEWGGPGGSENAYFTTTWAELMAGEEFAFEYTAPGDDGESWHWSIRFMAETS
jgi:hypothetical protein